MQFKGHSRRRSKARRPCGPYARCGRDAIFVTMALKFKEAQNSKLLCQVTMHMHSQLKRRRFFVSSTPTCLRAGHTRSSQSSYNAVLQASSQVRTQRLAANTTTAGLPNIIGMQTFKELTGFLIACSSAKPAESRAEVHPLL